MGFARVLGLQEMGGGFADADKPSALPEAERFFDRG